MKNESQKIEIKTEKIKDYWNQVSLLIPNVFRVLSELDSSSTQLLEFQDLSNKTVMVQSNGVKAGSQVDESNLMRLKSVEYKESSTRTKIAKMSDNEKEMNVKH
jgi:hypothetical protein